MRGVDSVVEVGHPCLAFEGMRKQIVAFELRVDELFERYQDIQRYVAWTTEDAERVRVAGAIV